MNLLESPGRQRRIGAIGTAVRVILGLAGLALPYISKPPGVIGGIQVHDLVLGLVVFPALVIVVGLLAKRLVSHPVHFNGPVGILANLGVLVAVFSIPYTGRAAALFYGVSLLIAAWRGMPGCEVTVLPNALLRRDDQIGCPVLSPLDAVEARHSSG